MLHGEISKKKREALTLSMLIAMPDFNQHFL
jgi:hypothetical protein